jgi:3-deoxy-D-manno-octulosonate 8-phosphate phosphatase (KDO 8-P phosphatase)
LKKLSSVGVWDSSGMATNGSTILDSDMSAGAHLKELLAPIQLVLMDVDGVLTDGRFYLLPDPNSPEHNIETKAFDSQDGMALQWLRHYDIAAGLISGRESAATAERARTAGFRYAYQGHLEKKAILDEILVDSGLDAKSILYIGDDLTDIVVMRRVGCAVAVANARPQVKRAANYVTTAAGGAGAVREVIELLLEAKGFWPQVLARYEAIE